MSIVVYLNMEVLIVAKCNVNNICRRQMLKQRIVLIVAKCNVKTGYSLIF